MTTLQIIDTLCRSYNKNQFERVKHPLRKDTMMRSTVSFVILPKPTIGMSFVYLGG